MMTKKQFARCLIRDFKCDNHLEHLSDEELVQFMYSSSKLCVALETLGVEMTKDQKEYMSRRGGVLYLLAQPAIKNGDKPEIAALTVREIMELLHD